MKGFLFFVLLLASGFWCYDNYGKNVPVHTSLTHVDGRSMDVVLLSRGKTQVAFERQSDGVRFSCGISDLSLLSKCKVYWYFRESSSANSDSGSSVVGGGDLHLNGIREEMEDLMQQLKLAQFRFNAAETGAQERMIMNEIEALQLDIDKLKLKQAEYLSYR